MRRIGHNNPAADFLNDPEVHLPSTPFLILKIDVIHYPPGTSILPGLIDSHIHVSLVHIT